MKNRSASASAMLLAMALISAPAAESKLVRGTVRGALSDSMCNGDHAGMIKMGGYGKDAASCTAKCLKEGNKLVFVEAKTKALYSLQNAAAAKKFAGKNVVISGHVDKTAKVIHVHSVKQG